MCDDKPAHGLKKPYEGTSMYHNPSRNALGLPANQSQNRQTNYGFGIRPNTQEGRSSNPSVSRLFPDKNWRNSRPNVNQNYNSQLGPRIGKEKQGGRQKSKQKLNKSKTKLSFEKLEALSEEQDSLQVAVELANTFNGLEYLLGKVVFLKERPDWILLISKVLIKVCECRFPENKMKVLHIVFESQFIELLINCVHEAKSSQETSEAVLGDISVLLDSLVDHFPTSSIEKLHGPVQQIFAEVACIEQFEGFQINDTIKNNFRKLETRLRDIKATNEAMKNKANTRLDDGEPPEDFRTFELYPYEEEIRCNKHAFIRRNIVDGGYKDVEHYLDVQFRLLREDLMIPLREGFAELIDKLSRGDWKCPKINYLRYFEHCVFKAIAPVGNTICYDVCFDVDRKLDHIDWEYNKWFMHGSLVFLSLDDFSSFLVGKVQARKNCKKHRIISVELLGSKDVDIEDWGKRMAMVESSVFFEPYYHVMKALKQFNEENFPLSQYIVEVNRDIRAPAYLQEDSVMEIGGYSFNVLDDNAWPSVDELRLDKFQYEALKSALTKEFAIMQGPPGTGKTFVGLKIIEALVKYMTKDNKETDHQFPDLVKQTSPILVVCYTNHALDQFLEGILKFTGSVVRVGSMTKSEEIEKIQLINYRQGGKDESLYSAYRTLKKEIKDIMEQIENLDQKFVSVCGREGILDVSELYPFMSPSHQNQLQTNEKFIKWLLGKPDSCLNDFKFMNTDAQSQETPSEEAESESDDEDEGRLEYKKEQYVFEKGTVKINICCVTLNNLNSSRMELENRCRELQNKFEGSKMKSNEYTQKRWSLESKYQEVQYAIETMKQQFQKFDNLSKDKNVTALSSNLAKLNIDQRWKLYAQWVTNLEFKLLNSMKSLEEEFRHHSEQYKEAQQLQDLNVLRKFNIVGLTTTAAARNHLLLSALKPSIVIVEEAAEVLEAHIVTSLTNHCQHLILIGDHQQLRPNPTVYKLAKQFNLEISLFERMINNKLSFSRLGVQHRMRPEICELITPAIYQNLQNHPSVYKFDDVRGITKNLFFVSHEVDEVKDDTMQSFRNPHEGDFILELAQYLLRQGYAPDEITILTTYSGQLIYLKMEKKKIESLSEVRVTTVDNYQGEECQIILLSLVRSNPEDKIGFLATSNRVCVALSRAKIGFYLIGNMKALESRTEIWKIVKSKLEEQNSFGTHLELVCAIHENKTLVREKRDFLSVPEGGCSDICNTQLACSHFCAHVCHSYDLEHIEEFACTNTCIKNCSEGHPCTYMCFQCSETCQPCKVPMKNYVLPCGHVEDILCFQTKTYPCEVLIEVDIEQCGHTASVSCHSITTNSINCPKPCDTRMPCGHQCTLKCHVEEDPDHIEIRCMKPCLRPKKECSSKKHGCTNLCWEPCQVCNAIVTKKLPCGHQQDCLCHLDPIACFQRCSKTMDCGHPCKKLCKDRCGGCDVLVDKEIAECGHTVTMKCKTKPEPRFCHNPCKKMLPCGHACARKCNEPCTRKYECLVLVEHTSVTSLCSHGNVRIPCGDGILSTEYMQELALKHCMERCEEILLCGHTCTGTCGECQQKRFHKVCDEKCERTHICGHGCKQDCSSVCAPCETTCLSRCRHGACNRSCWETCVPCFKDCAWECEHEKCPRTCSDMCRRPRCYEPCKKELDCGHQCIGFCGEPCPDKCRVCDEDEVNTGYLGPEKNSDARFVVLEDCGHSFESEGIEIYLGVRSNGKNMDTEIVVKTCPKCKTPIVSTLRFMNTLKFVRNNIKAARKLKKANPIQEKTVPQQKMDLIIRLRKLRISDRLGKLIIFDLPRDGFWYYFKKIIDNILTKVEDKTGRKPKCKYITVNQMRLFLFIADCLENIRTAYELSKEKHWSPISNQLEEILENLMNIPQNKISQQLKYDFFCEIDRLYALINLMSFVENYESFKHFKNKNDLTLKYTDCFEETRSLNKFDAKRSVHFYELLTEMQNEINANIPSGMRFNDIEFAKPNAALWQDVEDTNIRVFKCFRNHLYHVTQAEIANVEGESACPECATRGSQPQPNQSKEGPFQRDANWKYQANQGKRPNPRYQPNQRNEIDPRPNQGLGLFPRHEPNRRNVESNPKANQGKRPNPRYQPNQRNETDPRPNQGLGLFPKHKPNQRNVESNPGSNQGKIPNPRYQQNQKNETDPRPNQGLGGRNRKARWGK